jgi:hypothetical protein
MEDVTRAYFPRLAQAVEERVAPAASSQNVSPRDWQRR